ncbi:hypothetical protein HanXRQr2_Chr11g0486621 [Helianthus annuus]|uniref:Uncharacterized protein n=1 Tax=Helianthus annuus TaxID=4232 RepID=A0A9K3MZP3_HELAN|nr:hypothetical protein HanXRQr2_Chr11g0486621 [Helianthus annuus]KAJ0874818.1 hypothetical protein HanPSC8_Chr11g0468741 [Helianthus annuus]
MQGVVFVIGLHHLHHLNRRRMKDLDEFKTSTKTASEVDFAKLRELVNRVCVQSCTRQGPSKQDGKKVYAILEVDFNSRRAR